MQPQKALLPLGDQFGSDNYSSYFHPEHPLFRKIHPDACRTIAVSPFFSNPRMLAQRAAFTLCGASFNSLEEQFGEGVVKKIVLPPGTNSDVNEFLQLVGINHFGYFPDIANLVRDLKDEIENDLEKAVTFSKEKS